MKGPGRSNALVGTLLNQQGEDQEPLRLRTAEIVDVDKTVDPWTVTIRIGNVDIDEVTMSGWYDPRAGDVVKVLQQGPELYVLGSLAPGKVYMPAAPPAAKPAPAPAPAPTAASTRRNVSVQAHDSAGWQFTYNTWRTDRFIQGGIGAGRYRPHWFYGNAIQVARGSGKIVAASIFVKRKLDGGVFGNARVLLGVHNLGDRSGSGSGALEAVAEVGSLGKNTGAIFSLTQLQLDLLNAGRIGLGLEARAVSYTDPDYLPAYGRDSGDWSGALTLTIEG